MSTVEVEEVVSKTTELLGNICSKNCGNCRRMMKMMLKSSEENT